MSRILTRICTFALIIAIISSLSGCAGSSKQSKQMDQAENLMESRPDSALSILNNIRPDNLHGKKQCARYALLKSMALDKNYIDTTTFDVLQPAIDYYLEKGTPDEKLSTLYYQGRIFQNRGEDDSALRAFLSASDYSVVAKDTLKTANNNVALGVIYFKQYDIDKFIEHNLLAAQQYCAVGKTKYALKSYANAFDGYVISNDRLHADSIMSVASHLQKTEIINTFPSGSYLSYVITFGTLAEIEDFLNTQDIDISNIDNTLDYARAYSMIGKFNEAEVQLQNTSLDSSMLDSLKYTAIKVEILKNRADYKEALSTFEDYSRLFEKYQNYLMSRDLLFAKDKHNLEMKNLSQIKRRDRIIYAVGSGLLFLMLVSCWMSYRYRLAKAKQSIAEIENTNLRLMEENLLRENERIALERDKNLLEVENLNLEKQKLEMERDDLKTLLEEQNGLSRPLQDTIRTRLNMLNSLLAKELSNNESYAKPYKEWIETIRRDKAEFMNSTRLAFTASHPKFINYLIEHGLSAEEINYLCLYALGLRGKEIGEYMNLKRHYNNSSEIRKKLV